MGGNSTRRSRPAGVLPSAARLYVVVVAGMAALAAAHTLPGLDLAHPLRMRGALLVLPVLFLLCDSVPTTLTSRHSAWSPSSAATLAAVVLLGPPGAVAVGATSL